MSVDPSAVTAAEPGGAGAGAPAPQTIGKYRLDRVLGAGGMGIVWAAFDQDLERAVALKLLHGETDEPTLRSRLLREAQAMARLRHPNVVTVFDIGTAGGRDFIAMELVDGTTLEAWLDSKPPPRDVAHALIAAGRGLAAAHAAGLVHRDFKPHNVLRARDGHIYVTDFGLARGLIEDGPALVPRALPVEARDAVTPGKVRDSLLDSPLTQTGVLIGTPAYMAPEQFTGATPDPKSDQFAFCVTAWEALTGERPFRGATLEELEGAVATGVDALPRKLPPPIHAVLVRGLARDPAARWPDLPALLRALDEALAEPRPIDRRKRALAIGALAAAVAGIVGGAALLLAAGDDDGDGCEPPGVAFRGAWNAERRAALRARHPGGAPLGAIVLLDQVQRRWERAYAASCAAPSTPALREQRACLREARDVVHRTVDGMLQEGSTIDMIDLAAMAARVEICDQDGLGGELEEQLGEGLRDELRDRLGPGRLPPPGVPPAPPPPPTSGR